LHSAPDAIFRTLADPTRRAIFERLAREREQTVGALTRQSGVSQPTVSKHLAVLKLAGLVRERFRPQDEAGYRGMGGGWPRILGRLEEVAARS
jgi:DNA-binding transcriptional ArsR family regulator